MQGRPIDCFDKDSDGVLDASEAFTTRYSLCRMGISCDFLTIYDDLYKTDLWGICITLNLFIALTSARESIYDVIKMAAIFLYMNYLYFHQNKLKTSHFNLLCTENV